MDTLRAMQLTNVLKRMVGAIAVLSLVCVISAAQGQHKVTPKDGFVPDEKTAIKIAEAVLLPIYGAEKISKEEPFVAKLKNRIWLVSGTLPRGWIGGVAIIEISKADGKILRVSHGK